METQPRLLCVLAHPDDAAMALGGLLARYADEGVAIELVCVTRGEREWSGARDAHPGVEALGDLREAELRAAADELGIRQVTVLGYVERALEGISPAVIAGRIAGAIREARPHVVVTHDPLGFYGDPDHVAVSQLATAATLSAAAEATGGLPPHCADKLYYLGADEELLAAWRAHFGRMRTLVDGVERAPAGWPPWAMTTRIDAAAHWRRAWRAVCCHASQLPQRERLERLPPEIHQRLWCTHTLYRAFSRVNGGRAPEDDLFAGLR